MLFIPQTPTLLLLAEDSRVILCTPKQLFLGSLHFIEEYLCISICQQEPLMLNYSSSASQVLLVTQTSLELFWTDWEHRIQLNLVLSLYQEKVYSIQWQEGWQAYGHFRQYSPRKLRLWRVESIDEENPSCFWGCLQFIISQKRLIIYNHQKHKLQPIEWDEAGQYIPQMHRSKEPLQIFQPNEQLLLLQGGNTLLMIKEGVVQQTLRNEGELVVSGRVATWLLNGSMKVYTLEENAVTSHGQMDAFEGHFYGSAIDNDQIMMLFYAYREIRVRVVHLVSEQDNLNFQLANRNKIEKRQGNMSIQHQSASLRKIEIYDHDRNQSLDFDTLSEKIHLSGNNLRKALKESITKFQESFDRSYEEEKFDQKHILPHHHERQDSRTLIRDNSLTYYPLREHEVAESPNIEREKADPLKSQKYEQSVDKSIGLSQTHQFNISCSTPPAETPAFKTTDRHFGDPWSNFQSAWDKGQSKKEVINAIDEEYEIELNRGVQAQKGVSQDEDMDILFVESESGSFSESIQIVQQGDSQEGCSGKEIQHNISLEQDLKGEESYWSELGNGVENVQSCPVHSSRRRRILQSNVFPQQQMLPGHEQGYIQTPVFQDQCHPTQFPQPSMHRVSLIQESAIMENLSCCEDPQETLISPMDQSEFNKSRVLKPLIIQQTKRYTKMLSEVYRRDPQHFEELLAQSMEKVIGQKEARLFFAEHIRNFNADMTRDKLLRLYKNVKDTPQNRTLITKALSEFKLKQVPSVCLSIDATIVSVFRLIDPEVYIEDLLQPSKQLIQGLMVKYFVQRTLANFILIDDITIDLESPRNMLNILLYLNESFQLPLHELFHVYLKELIKQDHLLLVKKIAGGDIPKICNIGKEVFEQAAQAALLELLEGRVTDFSRLENILPLTSQPKRKSFAEVINLAEDFSICGIIFDIRQMLNLLTSKCGSSFLRDVITLNCASVLAKLNLQSVLAMVSIIEEGKSKKYYSVQSVQITRALSYKLATCGFVREGFTNLIPIAVALERPFLAGLLIKCLHGCFANRLVNTAFTSSNEYKQMFSELLNNRKVPSKGDQIPLEVSQHSPLLTWLQFNSLTPSILSHHSWELRYLVYCDIDLVFSLLEQDIVSEAELKECCRVLGYAFKKSMVYDEIDRKAGNLKIRFGDNIAFSNQSDSIRDISREYQKQRPKVIRSLKSSEKSVSSVDQFQSLSRSFIKNDQPNTDPVLFDIKFEVIPKESIKILKEYYEDSTLEEFFSAVQLADHQKIRINLKYLEIFKELINLDLNFSVKHLVPFDYFFDRKDAWNLIKNDLAGELSVDNFWSVFLAIELLYQNSAEIFENMVSQWAPEGKGDAQDCNSLVDELRKSTPVAKQILNSVSKITSQGSLLWLYQGLAA